LLAGCSKAPTSASNDKSIAVDVTIPVTGQVVDYEEFTGRMDAQKTVDIRARVSGYVIDAPFKEGDEVKEGDLLFKIDARTYEADRNQAKANLKLAEADSRLQEKIANRDKKLVGPGGVSQEVFETSAATSEKAKATVKAMEAARDRAELFVDYTRVIAPWSGRISRRMVDPGNLVNADNTVLTTMVTQDPLYAYFDVDERTYLNLVDSGISRATSWNDSSDFPVVIRLANEAEFSRVGKVNFVDNRVNAATGTIRMRGVFPNENKTLKPGLFARIRLPIGAAYEAILVPDEAVLPDQDRKYVFVVNDDQKVVYRSVTVGQEIGGMRVIKNGISLKDKVIISGMQRVREGSKVRVTEQKPPQPPESKLVKLLTQYLSKKNGDSEKKSEKEPGKPGDNEIGKLGDKEKGKPGEKDKRDGPVPAGN
jgi:RND family efflux transporter MFP subunit